MVIRWVQNDVSGIHSSPVSWGLLDPTALRHEVLGLMDVQ